MTDEPKDVQAIIQRMDALERQNRWLIRAGLVASLLAVAAVTMGQGRPSRTVEAEQFILRDAQGRPTARIGNDNFGSGPAIEFLDPKGGKDTLFFSAGRLEMNAPSDLRAGLKADPDLDPFGPHIFLDDKDGVTRVSLGLSRNRPSLVIKDAQGFYAQLGSADLETTRTGEERQTSAASLTLFGKDGKVIWSAP